MEDNFINSIFKTRKGGTLTVTGVSKIKHSKDKYYKVECSLCSQDQELFPEGFVATKANLKSGKIPCGCSSKYLWGEDQRIVQIKRLCKDKGYIFNGWVDGIYKKSSTRIKLFNPVTNNKWEPLLNNFILGRGDPLLPKFNNTAVMIRNFNNINPYTKDFTLWRSNRKDSRGRRNFWYYSCPHCLKDEYCKEGLCDGIFEIHTSTLMNGGLACRCSTKGLTLSQMEYKLYKICNKERLIFLGSDKNNVFWRCGSAHTNVTTISNFLHGNRCNTCKSIKTKRSDAINGFFPERSQEQDNLYILRFDTEYIKIGRSFDVERRVNELSKISGFPKDRIKVFKLYSGIHIDIYMYEQKLHERLRSKGLAFTGWSSELFKYKSLKSLDNLTKDCYENNISIKWED